MMDASHCGGQVGNRLWADVCGGALLFAASLLVTVGVAMLLQSALGALG